jgi:long-chain acyl-CoA synthetase
MINALTGPGDILPASQTTFGDKPALITAARTLSYTELEDISARVAGGLRDLGVKPGDVVSLFSPNRWEWIVSYHAALRLGAIVNPINGMLTIEEVHFILRDCAAVVILTTAESARDIAARAGEDSALQHVVSFDPCDAGLVSFASLVSATRIETNAVVDPVATSTIGYTSGTTGHPKGAEQSHRAVLLNCAMTATMHARTDRDVVVTGLPTPHVYGNVSVNSTFMAGGTVVLMDRFDAAKALGLVEKHSATMIEGVPAMFSLMLADPAIADYDLSSLTRSTVGGQTIAGSTVDAWQNITGARLIELWGMTEVAGLGATHSVYAPPVPGSIGVSLPGIELRISALDDVTKEAERGTPGELMVRGPIVMNGYSGNPVETKRAIESDGWLHTGDIARMDDCGYVFIVDRRKDMIITAGYNVYPAEIERVVAAHPAVALVAVGPLPDEVRGELACAYVVLKHGTTATEEELITFTKEHLAPYKRPRTIRFVDALPQTSTGKIMRRKLADENA